MNELDIADEKRKSMREQLRLDTLASWEHYKATGLHITHEEMRAWMRKIEAGEDAELPECHT